MTLATPTTTVTDPANERELAAIGLHEFTNIRTYTVAA